MTRNGNLELLADMPDVLSLRWLPAVLVTGSDDEGQVASENRAHRMRPHFVKATVQVRRYADDTLALFYGPRRIGRYQPDGTPLNDDGLAA